MLPCFYSIQHIKLNLASLSFQTGFKNVMDSHLEWAVESDISLDNLQYQLTLFFMYKLNQKLRKTWCYILVQDQECVCQLGAGRERPPSSCLVQELRSSPGPPAPLHSTCDHTSGRKTATGDNQSITVRILKFCDIWSEFNLRLNYKLNIF